MSNIAGHSTSLGVVQLCTGLSCRSVIPSSIISTRVRLILVLVGPAKTAGVESTESTVTVLSCHRYSRAQLRVQRNMIGLTFN